MLDAGLALLVPFVLVLLSCRFPARKFFFILRVLVYHNHLHSRIKKKMHVKTGILDYSANLKAKPKEFFDSIPCGPLRQAAPAPAPAPADPVLPRLLRLQILQHLQPIQLRRGM